MPVWLSDALCRLTTGGGFATRELYTDREEAIFEAQRPGILNSITELAVRGDVLDRSIILYLPQISSSARRRESEIWEDFAVAKPMILGGLLDAVSCAIVNQGEIAFPELPRMADFAAWATAAAPALGLKKGTFIAAYALNRQASNDLLFRHRWWWILS